MSNLFKREPYFPRSPKDKWLNDQFMLTQQDRYKVLLSYTKRRSVIEEALVYTKNKFIKYTIPTPVDFELEDESFNDKWREYLKLARQIGVANMLRQKLVPFQFPIKKGICRTKKYKDATLRGLSLDKTHNADYLFLYEPDKIDLVLHSSIAGQIPVLTIHNDLNFCNIVRALSARNEPRYIPNSMGAAMISGIINWERIRDLKNEWQRANPFRDWNAHFRSNVSPHQELYTDRLIVLSIKPYSGISADELGLSSSAWTIKSIRIRLEHECTHYFTKRVFGQMNNNIHDELLADYMGISSIEKKFNSIWFLKFMGLESYPNYRKGGRLQNYMVQSGLSNSAIDILEHLTFKAANNIQAFEGSLGIVCSEKDRIRRLLCLCSLDLVELSAKSAISELSNHYQLYSEK